MNQEEMQEFMLESVEGLMAMLQTLVLALAKDQVLDTAKYARLLVEMQEKMGYAEDSYQVLLIHRMLGMLVEGNPDVLVRRMGMHAVPTEPASDPESR
jgi:restriction endonuclease Mrr